jgi:hypothetical protein
LPEIAQDRISSVKFDPYQDCFNSSGASQSEDRNDKQKTGFFDSIDQKALAAKRAEATIGQAAP